MSEPEYVQVTDPATVREARLALKAKEGLRHLLALIDPEHDRDGLKDTPGRVVRAMVEMTRGYQDDPDKILSTQFDEKCDEVVVVRGIDFVSLCEHHLLPFTGKVTVGYLPAMGENCKVVGLSKIGRLVDCFSRRLQIQERMTEQIAKALEKATSARGVAVVVEASHACMTCRGVGKAGASMVTSCSLGAFRLQSSLRAEFFALSRLR